MIIIKINLKFFNFRFIFSKIDLLLFGDFSRRAGIEPAYSDYEPNELPVTQPPLKQSFTE